MKKWFKMVKLKWDLGKVLDVRLVDRLRPFHHAEWIQHDNIPDRYLKLLVIDSSIKNYMKLGTFVRISHPDYERATVLRYNEYMETIFFELKRLHDNHK